VVARLMILVLGVVSLIAGVFLSCQMWRYRDLAEGIAWLEDRHFERATLIAVGTGGAAENLRRLGPATAIGVGTRIVLVDAGRGVADALRHCAIPIAQPDTLLLTSLLPENTLGLDDLLLTGWNTPRAKPLRLLGPPEHARAPRRSSRRTQPPSRASHARAASPPTARGSTSSRSATASSRRATA